jgi:hypothetical protein
MYLHREKDVSHSFEKFQIRTASQFLQEKKGFHIIFTDFKSTVYLLNVYNWFLYKQDDIRSLLILTYDERNP